MRDMCLFNTNNVHTQYDNIGWQYISPVNILLPTYRYTNADKLLIEEYIDPTFSL